MGLLEGGQCGIVLLLNIDSRFIEVDMDGFRCIAAFLLWLSVENDCVIVKVLSSKLALVCAGMVLLNDAVL